MIRRYVIRLRARRASLLAVAAIVAVAALAAALSAYSVTSSGLHPREVTFSTAKAEVLLDTAPSNLLATSNPVSDYQLPQYALTYVLYLKSDVVDMELAQSIGIKNAEVATSGPFTLLLDRHNGSANRPSLPSGVRINGLYRLVFDVDGADPTITIYSQAPSTRDAIALVTNARTLLAERVKRDQAGIGPSANRVVLRPLGATTGGVVDPGATLQLLAFVFALVLIIGLSLLYAWHWGRGTRAQRDRSRATLDRLDDEPRRSDDWPHTTRVLPWTVAVFVAMVFLLPFDAIKLPINLPLDSTLDRVLLIPMVLLWLASLLIVSGAGRPRVKFTAIHFAVLFFFAVCCLSITVNGQDLMNLGELTPTVKKLALLASFITFFFVVASTMRPREGGRFAAFAVVLGVIVAIGTIIEYRWHYNPFYELSKKILPVTEPSDLYGHDSIGRTNVYGPTSQPLELAAIMAMMLPFAFLGAVDATTRRGRILYTIAVALLIAGGLATSRKTSLVDPLVAILVILAVRPNLFKRALQLGVLLVVVVHFTSPGALGAVVNELLPGHVNNVLTTTDRTARYDAVRPDVMSHLLLGRGFSSYDVHKYRVLDNEYLQIAIGVGLIGTVAFIAMFIAMLASTGRTIRGPDPRRASLALAVCASLAAVMLANALFDVLAFPHLPYLMFFIAAIGLAVRVRSPSAVPPIPWAADGRGERVPIATLAQGVAPMRDLADREVGVTS